MHAWVNRLAQAERNLILINWTVGGSVGFYSGNMRSIFKDFAEVKPTIVMGCVMDS